MMLWKIIIVFLCAMVLVGMIGKLLFPNAEMLRGRAAKCRDCGRPTRGRGSCNCRKAR
ncbi:hypothetical protein HOY34_01015 [Xinfangfangia sp. D13-10-4-6]|uniref:hypothetical protein n=1 Tax=Pseudogemmobacter hezensis TaxID=2737662 RepID=UPI001554122B|nr:hypothetical protein [Pseudogemmobacter hezensis]NPD13779.1 hypothetical protein [Pseudogemmobacter hezensis]